MQPPITNEQNKIIFDYIYITYLINVLEEDLKKIPSLGFKLHEPYQKFVEEVLRKVRKDLQLLRVEMKKHELKIGEPQPEDIMVHYDYWIGHKEGFKRMLVYHLRNEAMRRLEGYFKK